MHSGPLTVFAAQLPFLIAGPSTSPRAKSAQSACCIARAASDVENGIEVLVAVGKEVPVVSNFVWLSLFPIRRSPELIGAVVDQARGLLMRQHPERRIWCLAKKMSVWPSTAAGAVCTNRAPNPPLTGAKPK